MEKPIRTILSVGQKVAYVNQSSLPEQGLTIVNYDMPRSKFWRNELTNCGAIELDGIRKNT